MSPVSGMSQCESFRQACRVPDQHPENSPCQPALSGDLGSSTGIAIPINYQLWSSPPAVTIKSAAEDKENHKEDD
jgi:hypothetical protein